MREVEIQSVGTETVAHLADFGALGDHLQCGENAHHGAGIQARIGFAVPFAVELLVGNLEFDIALLAAFFARGIAHAVIRGFAPGAAATGAGGKERTK